MVAKPATNKDGLRYQEYEKTRKELLVQILGHRYIATALADSHAHVIWRATSAPKYAHISFGYFLNLQQTMLRLNYYQPIVFHLQFTLSHIF
jgi:hypothetical protein